MAAGDPLPAHATVVRLPTVRQVHVSGEQLYPRPDAFALSSAERAARDRGERVRVSVWDLARISVAAARASRATEVVAFALEVGAVTVLANALAYPGLRVVEDPDAAPPDASPQVRSAHAGIEGLDVAPPRHSNPRILADAREGLARLCVHIQDE